jgi:5-methylcytosine-specific restriction endonuclease McrA
VSGKRERLKRRYIRKIYRGVCQYCHAEGATTVDHIVPKSKGGTWRIANLTLACESCNWKKRDKVLPDELIQSVQLISAQLEQRYMRFSFLVSKIRRGIL